MSKPTTADVKANLLIPGNSDDTYISGLIDAATAYAEGYQHVDAGYYSTNEMPPSTKLAVIMLASFFYESRTGGTEGFFGNTATASVQAQATVNNLLRLDREWKV